MTVAEFLANTSYFSSLSEAAIGELIDHTELVVLGDGDEVFAEGDAGDAWYLVVSGEVVITRTSDRRPPHVLGTLEPGEGFGEMALLDDSRAWEPPALRAPPPCCGCRTPPSSR